ncbi:exodeoxyribonuclease III [Marinicella sp. W31]|uniref:exodeoxyribonuclease III n=1 Tax=Marinicella sp. W31 TaxID=3023713 RepID=UPI0037575F63
MKIITLNANGIRAAQRKGFFDWFAQEKPDVVCIQETKAQLDQLAPDLFIPQGYHFFQSDAVKKGYSGVSVYCKQEPKAVQYGIDWQPFDSEGRWLQVDLEDLTVVSLYLPSGTSGDERQNFKYASMDKLEVVLQRMIDREKPFVVCGDWNIAHKKIDIKNWRGNQKNSGFLPEERAWMTKLFEEFGLVDGFRETDDREEQYTWWSNRGQAWANNTGWRIDYHIASENLKGKVKTAGIYKDERFSDHAPLTLEYDL